MPQSSMGANTILGICGSHLFTKPESYIFNWYPLLFTIVGFGIITPLTMYELYKTLNAKVLMNASQEIYNKELFHLSVRLVLYTFLLCASCICFMYIIGELLFNNEKWLRIAEDYVFCLVFETYLDDIGLSGDSSKCELDPNKELPISVYFMQGTVVLLASSGSFILSCSNARYTQWRNVENKIVSKMKSVSSMGSVSRQSSKEKHNHNICDSGYISKLDSKSLKRKKKKKKGNSVYLPSPKMISAVKSKSIESTVDTTPDMRPSATTSNVPIIDLNKIIEVELGKM